MTFSKRRMSVNKVILFLVEGETDRKSLALAFAKLIGNRAQFFVIRTDITSDKDTTTNNIESLIVERVSHFLSEKSYLSCSDIKMVVQITDTDGTFVEGDKVCFDSDRDKIHYSDECMYTNKVEATIQRNQRKSENIKYLCNLEKINVDDVDIPYRVYFMSCNLEHVLHNLPNVETQEEKETLATAFRKSVDKDTNKLRDILFAPGIDCSGEYEDSWGFIQRGLNSLKRKSNLSHFFTNYIDKRDR